MATQAQIRANRLNAKKSTGPRTAAGKGTSKWNSLRHGLAARLLLPWEDREAFDQFREALIDELKPSLLELPLIDDYAMCYFRLLRLRATELGMLRNGWQRQADSAGGQVPQGREDEGLYVNFSLTRESHFQNFFRWQTAIERAWHKAFDKIERTQKLRLKGDALNLKQQELAGKRDQAEARAGAAASAPAETPAPPQVLPAMAQETPQPAENRLLTSIGFVPQNRRPGAHGSVPQSDQHAFRDLSNECG